MPRTFDFVPLLVALTVITGLGWVALAILRHASAALRHRLALATLVAALVAPAAFLLPKVALPILPPRASSWTPPAAERSLDAGQPAARAVRNTIASAWAHPAAPAVARPEIGPPVKGARVPWRPPVDPATALFVLWIAVAFGLMARVLFAVAAARHLVLRSQPVGDRRLSAELALAREQLGIRRSIDLRYAPGLAIPAVFGWRHPSLLLPESAGEWSRERLRSVLVHELAHVARHDAIALFVGHAATALFWFHPAVWFVARHARLASEQACDDRVLTSGVLASQYARELIAITQSADESRLMAGVAPAFARRSALGTRLMAVLAPGVRRDPVSRRSTASIVVVAALLLVALGSLRVVAAPATDSKTWAARNVESVKPAKSAQDAAEKAATLEKDELAWKSEKTRTEEKTFESTTTVQSTETRSSDTDPNYEFAQSKTSDIRWKHISRDEGETWYDRASESYDSHRYAEAGAAFMKAAEYRYRTDTAYYNAACSFALAGKLDAAVDALQKALDAGFDRPELIDGDDDLDSIRGLPEYRRLLDRAMHTDKAMARKQAAISEYDWLRKNRSSDDDAWRSIGVDLLRAGDYDRSLQAFEAEYAIDSAATALYNQACALARAGRAPAALDRLEQSILAGYGGDDHMAEDEDLRTLRGQRRFAELRMMASDLELQIDDNKIFGIRFTKPDRASLTRYERVAKEYPNVGRAWFNLGYAALVTGNHERSAEAFHRALDLGYRRATTMYNLGCVYAQLRQPDEAIRWLERAEGAGMDLRKYAENDNDLEPLRSDPRFKKMRERWYREKS